MRKLIQSIPELILAILAVLTILGGQPYFFPDTLTSLYGIDLDILDEVTIALLQHRGMIVAVIGFLLIPSIFNKSFGKIAIPLVIFSKVTFVLMLFPFVDQVGSVYFDIVAIVLLLLALGFRRFIQSEP